MKCLALLVVLTAVSVSAQTNKPATTNDVPLQSLMKSNEVLATAQHIEELRGASIQNRRLIYGKIIKILPDGLVVDSGYSSLMKVPANGAWLLPATVVATRDVNVVEKNEPDAICIGQVFLTDMPKSRGAKPKLFDYVKLEGFPMGQYTYASVGDVHHTVRKFTCKLQNAVKWQFEQEQARKPEVK